MAVNSSFKSWQEYMGFKSPLKAILSFHVPVVLLIVLVILLSRRWLINSQNNVLACVVLSAALWASIFLLIRKGFFASREAYLKKYSRLAYSVAAKRFLIFHGAFWFSVLTMPLWLPRENLSAGAWFLIPGCLLIVLGARVLHYTLQAAGFDSLIYVYSYFPQEGKVLRGGVFSFLRHPAYAGWLYLTCGFALIRMNYASLACALINILGMVGLTYLEEKDILKSFKEYAEYKTEVPAFLPRRSLEFLKFLAGK